MSEILESNETVDIEFPVYGLTAPADHGYFLYSAISRVAPTAHQANWLGVHTLKGRRSEPGSITLPRKSYLRLRLPLDKLAELYGLAGATLTLGAHEIRCGLPRVRRLAPSETLWSRLVVVKVAHAETTVSTDSFVAALEKQLATLGVVAQIEIERLPQSHEYARRVVRVKGATVAGYGVYVRNLSESDSIRLQIHGLGGRRRIGCGLFVPVN